MTSDLSIALRIARGKSENKTTRLLALSIAGIVISTAVILIALSVIFGFKKQVASISYSQTGQISLYPYGEAWTTSQKYIYATDSLIQFLREQPEVTSVSPLLQDMALLKTKDDFRGLALYGIEDSSYNPFFKENLIEGIIPDFTHYNTSQTPIVLPSAIARRMSLSIGDKVHLYFLGDKIRLRAFTLVGIYQSAGLDNTPALCPSKTLRKLKDLPSGYYNRIAISLNPNSNVEEIAPQLIDELGRQQVSSVDNYGLSTAEELMPDLFAWLSMLDSNVIFLIAVMLIIGAFTMVSGVIIIILDKTKQIGILKALGANNLIIRKLFSYIALRLILQGLILGNIIAWILLYLQKTYHILKLNPDDYYMDSVPVLFDTSVWLMVNGGVFCLLLIVVLFSTRITSQVSPASTMKFE